MTKLLMLKPLLFSLFFSFFFFLIFPLFTQAQIVSETDIARQPENTPPTRNWVGYTRTGTPPSSILFMNGPGNPPAGCGSVQFSTLTPNEKAFLFNYDHIGKELDGINTISYYTYRTSGMASQVAALNIEIDYNGPSVPGGFSTLVFEPVYNLDQGAVVNNVWQQWDAYNGGNAIWWSTRPIPGVCARDCFVTWNTIVSNNPDATVLGGVGINQGSGNAGLVTSVDAFSFDNATYNFEPSADSDGDGQGDSCDNDDDNDGVPDAIDCDPMDPKNDKVIICHKGKEICVSQNAVNAHLSHGDNLGACVATIAIKSSGINEKGTVNRDEISLKAYPNPVASATKIQYSIPFESRVSIKIYDISGREVSTLVDASKPAGTYQLDFDARKLNGGIYFYKLTAISGKNQLSLTQKLILLQ